MERLNKVIAKSGICSRRKADELITSGVVKINGQVVTNLGTVVSTKDIVTVNGVEITKEEKETTETRYFDSSSFDNKERKELKIDD